MTINQGTAICLIRDVRRNSFSGKIVALTCVALRLLRGGRAVAALNCARGIDGAHVPSKYERGEGALPYLNSGRPDSRLLLCNISVIDYEQSHLAFCQGSSAKSTKVRRD